ncbi:HAD family hydrolase [Campylobacter geochelonis]|uniref:HAD family hydrolase n=1 Tax=Campylobacter geochelonis TaxID=1780362 RepID=UPI000770AA74|nr:HAD family hydrolase [Campylobacter geochelonis]CZE47316.1 putative phosphoserine phosphatase [Campylobacter geochelonis]CZE50543.1 putative phosphoserine phosphatase [Campylobacter geochelonis]
MTLSVFDLDKTLILKDSYDLWHEYLLEEGILSEDFIAKNNEMIELYDLGKLNMDEYIKFSVQSLSRLNLDEISALMPKFLANKISHIIHDDAKKWIKNADHKLIISATPEYVVKPIANLLKVDECIGVRLKVRDNYYIGEYHKPLSFQEGKVEALKIWLVDKSLKPDKIIFYTDSINDLAMCEFADETYCVNPDPKLRQIAKERGWSILEPRI